VPEDRSKFREIHKRKLAKQRQTLESEELG
jgi:hypothetical protein